jgi:hypothetical protein
MLGHTAKAARTQPIPHDAIRREATQPKKQREIGS